MGKFKNDFLEEKISEKIKFRVKKLKKYQEKFRKKAKAGSDKRYQIEVKICQEYISGKFQTQLELAKIFG
jgi:hypothetical protein